jgi:hypothetical protein
MTNFNTISRLTPKPINARSPWKRPVANSKTTNAISSQNNGNRRS